MMDKLAQEITTADQYEKLQTDRNLDFSYVLGDENRFRVNFFFQMDGLSAVFRIIPVVITSYSIHYTKLYDEIREDVTRPDEVTIRWFDENFEEHEETFKGFAGRVIQHEYDHLEGILFVRNNFV